MHCLLFNGVGSLSIFFSIKQSSFQSLTQCCLRGFFVISWFTIYYLLTPQSINSHGNSPGVDQFCLLGTLPISLAKVARWGILWFPGKVKWCLGKFPCVAAPLYIVNVNYEYQKSQLIFPFIWKNYAFSGWMQLTMAVASSVRIHFKWGWGSISRGSIVRGSILSSLYAVKIGWDLHFNRFLSHKESFQ